MAIAVQQSAGALAWAREFRVHQYVKNLLVLVPIVTARQFNYTAISFGLIGMLAFSLCASSVYVLNDIIDLEPDRQHPTKKNRPLASGAIKSWQAKLAIPILLAAGIACGTAVSLKFTLALLVYLILTTAYCFSLKKKLLVDVVVLAMLYTIRVVAGAFAIAVDISAWLLAFSMFIFLSLALMKRYSELALRVDQKLPNSSTRNYKVEDMAIIGCLAVASGFNAITIFALYISSPAVEHAYPRPEVLWLACPVLTYWIGRAMILAHRRMMNDDPVVFAIKDPVSRLAGVLIAAVVLLAMWKK